MLRGREGYVGGKGRVDTRKDLVCCVSLKRIIRLTCFGLIRHLYPYPRGEKGYTLLPSIVARCFDNDSTGKAHYVL